MEPFNNALFATFGVDPQSATGGLVIDDFDSRTVTGPCRTDATLSACSGGANLCRVSTGV